MIDFDLLILQILIYFFVVYFAMFFLFMYLIKSNKIKPSKVSRIFYEDDEKFIKDWEKSRKKHKLKYVLYYFIINSIVILVTSIIYSVLAGSDFNLGAFFGVLIGNTIVLPFRWNRNEEKYYKLLNNK